MASTVPSRARLLRSAALGLLAAAIVPIGSPQTAGAATKSFKPVDERGRSVIFQPRGVRSDAVAKATVRLRSTGVVKSKSARSKRVSSRKVRRAIETGRALRVRKARHQRGGRLVVKLERSKAPVAGACETGSFSPESMPGACWRPYSDDSPFNKPLPADPALASNSSQIADRWRSSWLTGQASSPEFGVGTADTENDWDHPIYFSRPSDPVYTVRCAEDWGTCEIEGAQVRIPTEARPAAGGDGHMAVIDQASGWEYDFWQVRSKPAGGGTITISWGGKTRIDGDGLGSDATAGNFGLAAGVVRPSELAAGQINHALFMVVECTNGTAVGPAGTNPGRECSEIGKSNANAPAMGQRFFLDMSEAEIRALPVPEWKKTLLVAMATYGLLVGDTGGGFIKLESGSSFTSFGYADPWEKVASDAGIPAWRNPATGKNEYLFDLTDSVAWQSKMRVVDPCVDEGTC